MCCGSMQGRYGRWLMSRPDFVRIGGAGRGERGESGAIEAREAAWGVTKDVRAGEFRRGSASDSS